MRQSSDGGCQRWSPTQQLEVMGVSVSVNACDVSLIPLKEFLIELAETDGMHSLRHDGLTHVKSSIQPSQSSCLQHFFHSAPTGQHKGWRINSGETKDEAPSCSADLSSVVTFLPKGMRSLKFQGDTVLSTGMHVLDAWTGKWNPVFISATKL